MKKFIAFSIVFTLLSAAVFADITVSGGVGLSFIPIGAIIPPGNGDTELVAGFGRGGGVATEMKLDLTGVSENGKAGFQLQWRPKINGSAVFANEIGDNAKLWVKPLDWIQIDAGRFVNNDIRGRMSSGAWFGDYTIPRPGEGDIFSNFDGKAAAMLSLKPAALDGLGVYVLINSMADTYADYPNWGASKGIGYVYENLQAAVSYAIPNIGLARVQYVGAHPAATVDASKILPREIYSVTAPQIQAAFAFTGVPNLTVDVGGKYSLPVTDPKTVETSLGADDGQEFKGTFRAPVAVGLGIKYVIANLTATVIVDGKFAGSYEPDPSPDAVEIGIELRPWLTVNYKINDTFTAQAEGGIVYTGDSEQGSAVVATGGVRYGFGAALQTTFASDCTLRTGITYAGGEGAQQGASARELSGIFSVPFIFSVSF
jgi:hypothetical protein